MRVADYTADEIAEQITSVMRGYEAPWEKHVTDEERIEKYLINSGLAVQSIEVLRPDFPRWIRRLREQGVDQIPTSPLTADGHEITQV